RIGTYNKIEKMESEEVVKKYVETRMKLAGATRKIFTDEAMHWLWEYSEHGVPRLVNKIAKLCLKAGETNNFHEISGDVVQQIGERFDKMTGPAVQKKRIAGARATEPLKKEPIKVTPEPELPKKMGEFEKAPVLWSSAPPPPPPPPPPPLESAPEPEFVAPPAEPFPSRPEIAEEKPLVEEVEEERTEEIPEEIRSEEPAEEYKEKTEEEYKKWFEEPPVEKTETSIPIREPVRITRVPEKEDTLSDKSAFIHQPAKEVVGQEEDKSRVTIAGCTITIEIPENVLDQTRSANIEQKRKIAGVLAAQTLEKNPQLTSSPTIDPVSVWSDILNIIMERLG
ncbi:MAG: hypothetical protein QUS12_09875, partial [Methanosarcina sp.]|nr:hypothetical protein [Methanosarcina sp.]